MDRRAVTVRAIEGIDKFLLDEHSLLPYALNPEFFEVLEAMEHLQQAGVIGLRQTVEDDQPQVMLVFQELGSDPEFKDALAFLRETLHLPPDVREFNLFLK